MLRRNYILAMDLELSLYKYSTTRRVVAHVSRTLSKAERNYSTTERERKFIDVILAINKYPPYLFGTEFKVITDHHFISWLTNQDPSGWLAL